jgi:hypothetical protein
MYVRWKRYARKAERRYVRGVGMVQEPETLHAAVLVESRREADKVRQRFVCHLGSIRERQLQHLSHRAHFWRSVERKLAGLELPDAQRAKIEAALAARVTRPTPAETAADDAAYAALWTRTAPPPR